MRAIGPYRVLGEIDSGGMGDVCVAEDTRLGRKVAIKTLRGLPGGAGGTHARAMREARAVAALNHPHVAAIYDVVQVGEGSAAELHIVMEYVPGETLGARLRRERLSVDEALRIAGEIADALAAAHAQGVIHRDLKPANIRLTYDGRVKVLDFGLATIGVPEDAETVIAPPGVATEAVSTISGTPGYMSPEQALGRPVDRRSDIYSLSLVLFEMLSGRRAFAASDLQSAAAAALSPTVPHVRDLNPAISPELDALVASGLATDPADRPQTASAYATALAALRTSNATPSRWPRAFAYVAAVLIVAAVAGVAATWRVWRRAPASTRPVIAVLPLANLSGDASKDYLGVGIADTLTTSLARLSSVSVVARDAEAAKSADVGKVARALGATLVVQGSVQTVGDRLHVNAKLLRPDGVVAWAGEAEAAAADLFGLESRLASALVDGLAVNTSAAERQQAARPPTTNREALDDYWRAMSLLDHNDQSTRLQAIEVFQRALARDPAFAQAHARLGDAYLREYVFSGGREWITKAMDETARAVGLDPASIDARMAHTAVLDATGRSGAAADELRKVLGQQPSNDEAHRQLGDILRKQGQPADALREFERAISIRPDYWRNHERLGVFQLSQGRASEAVAAFSKVVALRPDNGEGFQQLGTAYQTLGDDDRARASYERAITLNPNPAAYSNLGTLEYSAGRFDAAAAAYESALKIQPNRPITHRNLGDAYLRLGRGQDARREYQRAVELTEDLLRTNPGDAANISRLAVYEAKLGRTLRAQQHIDAAIAINPNSPDILYRTAVVHALSRRPAQAMRALGAAIDHGYSVTLAREDDDLASLRGRPEFRRRIGASR